MLVAGFVNHARATPAEVGFDPVVAERLADPDEAHAERSVARAALNRGLFLTLSYRARSHFNIRFCNPWAERVVSVMVSVSPET